MLSAGESMRVCADRTVDSLMKRGAINSGMDVEQRNTGGHGRDRSMDNVVRYVKELVVLVVSAGMTAMQSA